MAVRDVAAVERSSGERLLELLEATGLSAHQFAGYWAGFPAGRPIARGEESERGQRFRTYRRSLYRWLADAQVIGEENAREIVAVANRLLAENGEPGLPADFLVTREETRLAGMVEMNRKLDEVLDRLARIEERLS